MCSSRASHAPEIFINKSLVGISFGIITKLAFPGVTSFFSGFNEQFYRQIYFSVLVVLTSGSDLN